MRESTLKLVMKEVSPCDGCSFFKICGTKLMACRAFAYYVRTGVSNDSIPRDPRHVTYNRIFSEDDKEFNDLIRELYKEARDNDGF